MIERAQVQDACSRVSLTPVFADSLPELERTLANRELKPSLIVCDLPTVIQPEDRLDILIKCANRSNAKILGKYPHVMAEIRVRALSAGIDYVIPNSNFIRALGKVLRGRC